MKREAGPTVVELCVVTAIIAILAAILFPVFARAREKARQSNCQSNMEQIGRATLLYVADYDGCLPLRPQNLEWMNQYSRLNPIDTKWIICPAGPRGSTGFGFNLSLVAYPKFKAEKKSYLWDGQDLVKKFTPANAGWWMPTWIEWQRHLHGANIAFCDGHVKWYAKPDPDKPMTAIPAPIF